MTASTLEAPATTPAFQQVSLARKVKNGLATTLVWLSFLIAVVPLVWVLYTVVAQRHQAHPVQQLVDPGLR